MSRWSPRLRVLAVAVTLLLFWYTFRRRRIQYPCFAEQENHYLNHFASRTTYEMARGRNLTRLPLESKCVPVRIWAFIRHGARYPTSKSLKKYDQLHKLRDEIVKNHAKGRGTLCESDLELLKRWTLMPIDNEESKGHRLNEIGAEEMRNFGRRLRNIFPELLKAGSIPGASSRDYRFRATDNQRAQASLTALSKGIFEGEGLVVKSEKVPKNDTLLYTNSNCPTFHQSLKLNRPWNQSDVFTNYGAPFLSARQRIAERLGFETQITKDTILLLWDVCRFETAWLKHGQWSSWCSVLDFESIQALEFREDIGLYYFVGPGRPINHKIACPLVKDLIHRFRYVVKHGREASSQPKGLFYFGHTIMLGATLGAMGMIDVDVPFLPKNYDRLLNRKYRSSILGPFGGNIVFVLYKCGSESESSYKVTIHASERPWPMPGCPNGVCDWETFEQKYKNFADHCNLDFCFK